MAKANSARRHGDDFQARLFWLRAAALLDDKSPITKVCYEAGPKSFDDILIEYEVNAASPDPKDKPTHRESGKRIIQILLLLQGP
ncbi:MAG TPA: hypothetical protein DEA71_15710 [Nitrospira sp.]|nr:hypothetical protein [Nitrospira sp.]